MYDAISSVAKQILSDGFGVKEIDLNWERPQEKSHGDIATAVSLKLAKEIGKNPQEIADALVEGLTTSEYIEKVEKAGPGFVNVWLTPDALLRELSSTVDACKSKPIRDDEAPVVVEYSQPNIAKPLGVHHTLSTLIGQALKNIFQHQGYNTISVNHLGDWGTQFGKLSVAFEEWSDKPVHKSTLSDFLNLYVKFHDEAEKDESLNDRAREAFKKLEDSDEDMRSFWRTVVDITMKEVQVVYDRLHVSFDFVHGESFYEDKMPPIIEEGKKKGVFTAGEKGALIAEFPEDESMSPALILKSDGATLYHTRDLATMRYRIDTWHPQEMLYVVDMAQSLYFNQLFSMVNKLGWEIPKAEHTVVGRMRFADRSMSTRKGNILRLLEVLDESVNKANELIEKHGDEIQTDDKDGLAEMMGVGSVAYGVLSQNRKMDIVFDWDKMLSFDGNSAPYIQYTHARAKSVLRKADEENPCLAGRQAKIPESTGDLTEKERLLLSTLLQFSGSLDEACNAHMPHILANYLFQLCQDFNSFYNDEPILKADENKKPLRLALTGLTASVLKTGAELLTLRVPDRM